MFGQDRQALRAFYQATWQKVKTGELLSPLETQIAEVIALHPEYQSLLSATDRLEKDYTPEHGETNPFLHMGLHLAIREQVSTDRPAGIRQLYQKHLQKGRDAHEVEHRFMEILAEMIWQAQRTQTQPDDTTYLSHLASLK